MTYIRRALKGEEAKPSRKPATLNRCPSGSPLSGARAQRLPRLGRSMHSPVSTAVSEDKTAFDTPSPCSEGEDGSVSVLPEPPLPFPCVCSFNLG